MQKHWLKRNDSDTLCVFVLGWASDHRAVEHIELPQCDVLCIYDYENMGSFTAREIDQLRTYDRRHLFAWSFGVWAAEMLFSTDMNLFFDSATAINGTPFPVSARFGIEPQRFMVTVRGLIRSGTELFIKRAYGSYYEDFKHKAFCRDTHRNIAELENLGRISEIKYIPTITWTRAIIGEADVIFPPENMKNYWGALAEMLPLPHYPFADSDIITKGIERR